MELPAVDDAPPADELLVDAGEARRAMEYYEELGWTDGLPVVPVTESYLAEFLAHTGRDPGDVLLDMPHLNRSCTVRLAGINAALAGCRPEYFPVVVAAWQSLAVEGYPAHGIWQSTTGTAPFPGRERPGARAHRPEQQGERVRLRFRANATIGRAIRLGVINAFGLRPHLLDQATQGTPAKYTACIAENEEESPWPGLHTEAGLGASDSAVTSFVIRSSLHIEARHTTVPEQLATDIAGTISRTGALVHATNSAVIVLGPEHARLFAAAGWSKADLKRFMYDRAVRTHAELAAVGKDAISSKTRWRLPADHPDAAPAEEEAPDPGATVRMVSSPAAIQVIVAGAGNAGGPPSSGPSGRGVVPRPRYG